MSKCARCNRGLKDPTSIQRGFGPVCWAKAQADKSKEEQRESGGFYDLARLNPERSGADEKGCLAG